MVEEGSGSFDKFGTIAKDSTAESAFASEPGEVVEEVADLLEV